MAKSQLAEVLHRALTSTRAMSRLGVAIWVPLAMLRVVMRQTPLENSTLRATISSAALTGVAALFATWVVRQTVLRNQEQFRAPVVRAFSAYLLLLAIVGLVQVADEQFVNSSAGPSLVRLGGAVLLLYLISAVLDHFDSYRARLDGLVVEQQRVVWVRLSRAARLQRLRTFVVDELWSEVGRRWHEIELRLADLRSVDLPNAERLRDCATSIRNELIEPVRRRSYEVQSGNANLEAANASAEVVQFVEGDWLWEDEARQTQLQWREIIAAMPSANPFRPVPVALSLALLSFVNSEYLSLPATLITAVALTTSVFVMQAAARQWLLPVIRQSETPTQWVVFGCATVGMAGALVGIALWATTLDGRPYQWFAFVVALPMGTVFLVLWSAMGAAAVKTANAEVNLQHTIELRRQESLALEQEEISLRQDIAHILHGDVQTLLTSAAFRLDLAAEEIQDGVDIAGLSRPSVAVADAGAAVAEAAARVADISAAHYSEDERSGDVTVVGVVAQIDALVQAWNGIVDVVSSLDPATAAAIDERVNDAALAPIVVDVVREAILNAVRHAYATRVSVAITVADHMCRIVVVNDGRAPKDAVRSGLGNTMLANLGCHWSLTPRVEGGAQLWVDLPLLASEHATVSDVAGE